MVLLPSTKFFLGTDTDDYNSNATIYITAHAVSHFAFAQMVANSKKLPLRLHAELDSSWFAFNHWILLTGSTVNRAELGYTFAVLR